MIEGVHAGNITMLSREAVQTAEQLDIPAVDDLITAIYSRLGRSDARRFAALLKNVPDDFALVPVFYARVNSDRNTDLENEFSKNVLRSFLLTVAVNHADELKALGLCDTAIGRIQQGLSPASAEGFGYDLNVDHIIERAGCGGWAYTRESDPAQKKEKQPKYRVNHFSNLVILPTGVHSFKNELMNLQHQAMMQEGEVRCILTIAPKYRPGVSGYVCPPQKRGIRAAAPKEGTFLPQAVDAVKILQRALNFFKSDPAVKETLRALDHEAFQRHSSVAELADMKPAAKEVALLCNKFNAVVAGNAVLAGALNNRVLPALRLAGLAFVKAFNTVAAQCGGGKGRKELDLFAAFFNGRQTRTLRDTAARLPLPESAWFSDTMRGIDARLADLRQKPGF